ncbi:MAG: hypothetical protein JJ956_17830, partial [Pseudomonadales bacterium]|nr:hypothetical protein [Pseudomonadales bacterium]
MKDYENELTFHDEYVEVRGQRPTEIPDVLLVRPVLTEEQCAHIRGLWKGDVKRYDLSDRSYGSTYLDANQ